MNRNFLGVLMSSVAICAKASPLDWGGRYQIITQQFSEMKIHFQKTTLDLGVNPHISRKLSTYSFFFKCHPRDCKNYFLRSVVISITLTALTSSPQTPIQ